MRTSDSKTRRKRKQEVMCLNMDEMTEGEDKMSQFR